MEFNITLQEVIDAVVAEYDRRQLKSDVRYRQLNKIKEYIENQWNGDVNVLSMDKDMFKENYCLYQEKERLNGAESSAINELYNQYNLLLSGGAGKKSNVAGWFGKQVKEHPLGVLGCIFGIIFLVSFIVFMIKDHNVMPEHHQLCVITKQTLGVYDDNYSDELLQYCKDEDNDGIRRLIAKNVIRVCNPGERCIFIREYRLEEYLMKMEGESRPIIIIAGDVKPLEAADDEVAMEESPKPAIDVDVHNNFADGADETYTNEIIYRFEEKYSTTLESIFDKYYNKPIKKQRILDEEPLRTLIVKSAGEDALSFMKSCSKSDKGLIKEEVNHLSYIYDCYKSTPEGDRFSLYFVKGDGQKMLFIEVQRGGKLYKYQYSQPLKRS